MQFAQGKSRFVILIGHWAIKIAKSRTIYWIPRLFRRLKEGRVKEKLALHHDNMLIAVLKCLFPGVVPNRLEARFCARYENRKIEPIVSSILCGLVNIQRRGEAVREEDLSKCPFQDSRAPTGLEGVYYDLQKAEQFAKFGEEFRLIDFGNRHVMPILVADRETVLKTQNELVAVGA